MAKTTSYSSFAYVSRGSSHKKRKFRLVYYRDDEAIRAFAAGAITLEQLKQAFDRLPDVLSQHRTKPQLLQAPSGSDG
jgi:hypothetical protein